MDIITRAEWGASRPLPPKIGPTDKLILHHTVGRYRGAEGTRDIDRFHYEGRGWYYGFAYSFGIDPESLEVFEGRGALRQGGHTRGYNTTSHAIVVYGDFRTDPVSDELVGRIAELVRHGAEQGWWPARITHGHGDLGTTACPGALLYGRIPDINAAVVGDYVPETSDDEEFTHMLDTLKLYDGWKANTHLRNEVRRMQAWLAVAGHIAANTFDATHRPDGLFGPGTKDAVTGFQRAKGLTVDGICGPRTWEALADA